MAKTKGSARWSLNKADAEKILKALLWSLGSTVCASAILLLQGVEVPLEWAWLIPVVNMALVSVKKLLDDKK